MLQWRGDFFLDDGLAEPGGFEGATEEWIWRWKPVAQQWDDAGLEHGMQFAGRARQEDDNRCGGTKAAGWNLNEQARGGAVWIGEDLGAARDEGLNPGLGRHETLAGGEELFNVLEERGILAELGAGELGDERASEIIARGAEPAGDQDEIGPGQSLAEGVVDRLGVVGDGSLPGESVAEGGELAGDPLGVGVEDGAQHEFAAGINELDDHDRTLNDVMNLIQIETKRLTLVLQTREDVVEEIELMQPHERAELSAAWVDLVQGSISADPWIHGFKIVLRTDGRVIGRCGFKGPPGVHGDVEISYGIDPECQGKGYATEAARALTEYAFECGQVALVRAHTLPRPNASARVLTKCGFVFVGEVVDPQDGAVWRWETRIGKP